MPKKNVIARIELKTKDFIEKSELELNAHRESFKNDLLKRMDKTFAMMILKTYSAYRQRRHIKKILTIIYKFPNVKDIYSECLLGDFLLGNDDIFHSLYFTHPDLHKKFFKIIPSEIAIADAYDVALGYMKTIKDNQEEQANYYE